MRLLIVRLSSLGDVIHTIPVAAALRREFPDAGIDWVVDERNAEILELVPSIDRRIVLRSRTASLLGRVTEVRRALRAARYDVALDAQGLLKSALIAHLSRAERIIGFTPPYLREAWVRRFYTEMADPGDTTHVVDRNLGLLTPLGVTGRAWEFPLESRASSAPVETRRILGIGEASRFALVNPNTAWPNKCWPPERFGAVAAWLRTQHGLRSAVLWGPGDEARARAVAVASDGAAAVAPRTNLVDLVALVRAATVMVSGDTGPLHVAAAVGTPVVGIYGPSNPARNGPWSADDQIVSRFGQCGCHRERDRVGPTGRMVRRCQQHEWCLGGVSVAEVVAAVDRRLAVTPMRT